MMDSHRIGFGPSGVIFCAFFTFAAIACAGTYSGGSGTAEDPYKINKTADWQELIATSADWDNDFILLNDIDFGGAGLTPVGRDLVPKQPGFQGNPFSGVFDGNGHILRNAVINQPEKDYVGLFGCLQDWSEIINLGLENITVTGRQNVGCLVGLNEQWGTITSCYATGSVTGTISVGGLVGENNSWITASYSTCSVSGLRRVGGLVGANHVMISFCYATGSVTGSGDSIGGLVGFNEGTITGSFWDIETSDQIGSSGGKGLSTVQMKTMTIFQNAGWSLYDWILDEGQDYPRLDWQNTPGSPILPAVPVSLAGSGTPENPYQIWTEAEFALLSWHVSVLDKHVVLMTDLDMSGVLLYPIGILGPFTGNFDGHGYVIRNATIDQPSNDFIGLFGNVGYEGQIHNLGVENVAVKGRESVGGLVGHHKGTITSSYATGSITGVACVGGLCGYSFGTITSSHAVGSVTGVTSVGGLCGYNLYGPISDCYATGTVSGQTQVGGLCGGITGALIGGSIENSFATGAVNGDDYVGGLCGRSNGGWISKCYATGSVSGGQSEVGGLCGENFQGRVDYCYATGSVSGGVYGSVGGLCGLNYYGEISNSFATGSVSGPGVGGLCGGYLDGTISDCFWDMETSGQTTSAGGIGKTTAEMKTQATFTSAGWDFVGEAANGTEDVWRMCADGVDYPRLSWEFFVGGDFACPDGVALEDLLYLAGRWLASTPETVGAADVDGNGKVDLSDFGVMAEEWMK